MLISGGADGAMFLEGAEFAGSRVSDVEEPLLRLSCSSALGPGLQFRPAMNTDRLDQLTLEIEKYFAFRDAYSVPPGGPPVERHVVDMFEVLAINAQMVTLGHYHDGHKARATIGEWSVASLVRPGDVFLMTLIRRQGKWRVWYMSPPYEEVEFDEEGVEDLH